MPEVSGKRIDIKDSRFPDTLAIHDYWDEKRGSRFAPSWADFDLMDLPLDLIPRLVVIDVLHDPLDFRYRFWGTWHVDFHGYDQSNKLVSELEPQAYRDLIFEQYRQIVEAREPQLFVQQIPLKSGLWTHTELVRFPLSDDGESVNMVVSAESASDRVADIRSYFTE